MVTACNVPTIVRYASFLGIAAAFIGSTAVFALNQAQSGIENRPVVAKVAPARPSYLAPLPKLTAKDFDVARSVPVVVRGSEGDTATKPQPLVAAIEPAAAARRISVVTADAANIRSGPAKSTAKTFVLRRGAEVGILSSRDGWTEVRGHDGQIGWIWTEFLTR